MPQQKTSTTSILQKLNPMPMVRQLQAPFAGISQLTMPSMGTYWDGIRIGNRSLRLSNVPGNLGNLFHGVVAGSLMVGKAMADMTSIYFQANETQYRMDLDVDDYSPLNTILTQLQDGACGANTNLTEQAKDYTQVMTWDYSSFTGDSLAALFVNSYQTANSVFVGCINELMQPVLSEFNKDGIRVTFIILGIFAGVLVGTGAGLGAFCFRDRCRSSAAAARHAANEIDNARVESIMPLLGNASTNATTYGAIDVPAPASDKTNNASSTNAKPVKKTFAERLAAINIDPTNDKSLKNYIDSIGQVDVMEDPVTVSSGMAFELKTLHAKKQNSKDAKEEMPPVFPSVFSDVKKEVQQTAEIAAVNITQTTTAASKGTADTVGVLVARLQ